MIKLEKIIPIVKHKVGDYKYLSPFIFFHKKKYYLFFCNRGDKKSFYGEIRLLVSSNLSKWSRVKDFKIKPKNNSNIISYTSPCVVKKKIYYLYLQAQSKNFGSKIIRYKSLDFKKWILDKKFKIEENGYIIKSPYYSQIDKNYLYYSKENKLKKYIYKISFDKKKKFKLFKSEDKNENYSIYSPSLTKVNNIYYMIYAAWKNPREGNLKIAKSKNLIKWKKNKKYLFKLPKGIKIVSEPNLLKVHNQIYIFYEFKKNSTNWNMAYKKIKLKKISEL